MTARASLLGHGDNSVPGARDGPPDEQQIPLGIHLDHGEAQLGMARRAHVAGIRLPLMTRDRSVPGLIEPGFRCRVLPWVAGPPPKPWRCTTPWNPRPLVVPVTFTSSPAAKMSTFTSAPGASASPLAAAKVRSTWGA